MKIITVFFSMLLLLSGLKAQEPRYQTYSTSFTIVATKDGQDMEWRNKKIDMVLNYQTGDFIANIKGSDFSNKNQGQAANNISEASPDKIFKLSGIFPIDALINQQTTHANYQIELQLTNEDESVFERIMFDMSVTKPGDGEASYRIFILTGTLYANQIQLPAFEGMDNEIKLQLFFNAYMQN